MFSVWIHLFLLGSLCTGTFAAPCEETDPELTAGYFEGDIILDYNRNGLLDEARHWPNATVPYIISEEFGMSLYDIGRFFLHFLYEVYLFAIPSTNGCSANLGYGKKVRFLYLTPVGLDKGCFKIPVIQHELLHILGFQHQQSSPDRDEYVMIMEENIIEGREHNFEKQDSSKNGNYDQPYDYGSLLHYAPYAFSKNGEPTIVALNPEGQSQMGQRVKMSEVDINRLNTMYKCPIQT
ncbi:hypothetical protein KR059_004232 [Drosophila kikkawai]|nr:hypothetical protein KR059_004232 [Drosophila kikkawai]